MKLKQIFFAIVLLGFLSFNVAEKRTFEFNYPKQKEVKISLLSDHFKKFNKGWKGSYYYYFAENDGYICSVFFCKLNEQEKLSLVEVPKTVLINKFKEDGKEFPENSPIFAYTYFKNYSNIKNMETNVESWGEMTDDFMFRENVINIEGSKISQNHMYGYAMFGNDLFVNVHLSKINCTDEEVSEMKVIINSLRKEK